MSVSGYRKTTGFVENAFMKNKIVHQIRFDEFKTKLIKFKIQNAFIKID